MIRDCKWNDLDRDMHATRWAYSERPSILTRRDTSIDVFFFSKTMFHACSVLLFPPFPISNLILHVYNEY